MGIIEALILGFIQGATEFLPVSSSGHLILARELFGFSDTSGLAFDAVLQLATALAVLVYFRRDFIDLARSAWCLVKRKGIEADSTITLIALVLGTIPAIVFGLFLEDSMETIFRSAALVAWTLIAGSLLFTIAEWVAKRSPRKPLTIWKGIGVGFFQCLALVPGMSRSGSTISGGLLLGLSREQAARFGFLLSFPIIVGSGLKKLVELSSDGSLGVLGIDLLIGSIVAFVVGILAIHFLIRFLKTHTLTVFIVYRLLLAVFILWYL